MISDEVKKRLTIIFIAVIVIVSAVFVLFTFVLNKATFTVVLKPPFTVKIGSAKTVFCTEETCIIDLVPGKYPIEISKEGYKSFTQEIEFGVSAKITENPVLEFIPVIAEVSDPAVIELFKEKKVPDELKEARVFMGDSYLAYLKVNPETKRQTLYVRGTDGAELGPETAVTSFTRQLKDYRIFLNLHDNTKIAVIDDTNDGSVLYLIDTAKKTRDNIAQYPYIKSVKWFGTNDDFFFEAREEGDLAPSIFKLSYQNAENNQQPLIKKLPLQTDLNQVVQLDENTLIVVTDQVIQGADNPVDYEGELVVLGEDEATANIVTLLTVEEIKKLHSLKVIEYSLISEQMRFIKNLDSFESVQKIILAANKKSLYLMSGEKILEFIFTE